MHEPRFDEAPLAMLRRVGREALATRMIDLFLASGPKRVADIRGAFDSGDLGACSRAAHLLKPGAGQLGAASLQGICQEIEDTATGGDGPSVGRLLPTLEAEYAAAEAWLRSRRDG